MTKQQWVTVALKNDAMVAELLIRMKQPSHVGPATSSSTAFLPPITWGHRKSRSKPSPITTCTTNPTAVGSGFRKEQQSGSPTTPLYWSGGGGGGGCGASTSDGYDESSRRSDLSSGGRSNKGGGAFGNEGATTSSYKKSRKRKSFAELKEEEDFLLKERLHLNRELELMRVTMNKQIATSQHLKKFNIDLHQSRKKQMPMTLDDNFHVQSSTMVEPEVEAHESGFVLPDLNMTPDEVEL